MLLNINQTRRKILSIYQGEQNIVTKDYYKYT